MNLKRIVAILLTLTCAYIVYAQDEVYISEKVTKRSEFKWGPRVSFNLFYAENLISSGTGLLDDMGTGGSAGFIFREIWRGKWFIESGLSLGYGSAPVAVAVYTDTENPNITFEQYRVSRLSTQLPLHIGYSFGLADNLGMSIFTGGSFYYGISGRIDQAAEEPTATLPEYHLYLVDPAWRRISGALTFGLTLDRIGPLSIGLTANFGLNDMALKPIYKNRIVNETEIAIGMTYWIR